jgi:hypothetical protein
LLREDGVAAARAAVPDHMPAQVFEAGSGAVDMVATAAGTVTVDTVADMDTGAVTG